MLAVGRAAIAVGHIVPDFGQSSGTLTSAASTYVVRPNITASGYAIHVPHRVIVADYMTTSYLSELFILNCRL
jgi:hypothetical protein